MVTDEYSKEPKDFNEIILKMYNILKSQDTTDNLMSYEKKNEYVDNDKKEIKNDS